MTCKLFPFIISFLVLTFFFSLSHASSETIYENTTRFGHIYLNERWRGTIDVTGDVIINTGASVVIEPGSIVKFAANSDDQMNGSCTPDPNVLPGDPEMIYCQLSSIDTLGGNLYAVGTPDNQIVFTSSASNPQRGDWHAIIYHQRGSKLTLQHTIIEYGAQGVAIVNAADDSHISLRDNIIRHIVACGICVGYDPNGPVTITISGNDISDCGHEAIDTSANANLLIENNTLHDNLWSYGGLPYGEGVVIHENNLIIRNNQFIRNRRAIHIFDENSRPNILGNSFIDNDVNCFGFCPDPLQNVFSDVLLSHWAYNYIIAVYNDGITVGCAQDDPNTQENERRYCPEDNVTRGQMAAFIIRAKYGENFLYSTTPYFTDVPSTHTFFKYVQKLKDDGITTVSGTYGVDNEVTRGQIAAFIIRAQFGENFSYTTTPYFSDVPSTQPFFKYVQKLKGDGITTVIGTYGVDNIVTRAQMAAFLARAFLGME